MPTTGNIHNFRNSRNENSPSVRYRKAKGNQSPPWCSLRQQRRQKQMILSRGNPPKTIKPYRSHGWLAFSSLEAGPAVLVAPGMSVNAGESGTLNWLCSSIAHCLVGFEGRHFFRSFPLRYSLRIPGLSYLLLYSSAYVAWQKKKKKILFLPQNHLLY